MGMSKPSLVVLVVEDHRHTMLLRRYLVNCGLLGHEIRVERSPSGRGSAEAWVRRVYPKNVSAYRLRQARAESALIVMIDADRMVLQQRIRQLDDALAAEAKPALEADEQVARLVPKRNVETWILCLNNHRVDEAPDYKSNNHDWNALIPPAAEALCTWVRNSESGLPSHCTDSLRHGITELSRLNFREAA
jgi:hypothetical protein